MPPINSEAKDCIEALIVSGPRKGEFISIPKGERSLSPEALTTLNRLSEDLRRMVESTRLANEEAKSLLKELRQVQEP